MAPGSPDTEMEAPRHVREIAVECARTFAQGHDNCRQLAECYRTDRGGFGQTEPDIEQHGDDESQQIEQQHHPAVEQGVDGS